MKIVTLVPTLLCALVATSFSLVANPIQTLFNTLDPVSVAEALAFYELYSGTDEGKSALQRVLTLMKVSTTERAKLLPKLINRLKVGGEEIQEDELIFIEELSRHLPNRKLKGYKVSSEEQVLALSSDEIDLGMALILSQMDSTSSDAQFLARTYSAMLDLMALQILARLPEKATPLQKIEETNRFIFDQMHFRFPPHSVYAENIDLYTFLPSVMDNHLGVCLGVTALYLAIAQRIDLPLEIITPPGHIFVRYKEGEKIVNIETTARGVHYPDETYLSIQNSKLDVRNLKEVIGMTHVNQASTYLYKAEYEKAVKAYEKATPYMPDDPLVKELLGYSYLFTEKKEKGEALLKEIGEGMHDIPQDYLSGKVDLEGIESVFMLVDEKRESILAKQKRLLQALEKNPEFRDGLHQLAITWIQLNRASEAIAALHLAYQLDSANPITAYYLAVLHAERHDFKNAWSYLKVAEKLTQERDFYPKPLKELRRALCGLSPE